MRKLSFTALVALVLSARTASAWDVDGNPANPGSPGVTITTTSVHSVTDGSGGIFTCWSDNRFGNYDVFVQHLDSNGDIVIGWPSTGIDVCPLLGEQVKPQLAADGSGGVFVVWEDGRHNDSGRDIYAIRLTGAGAIAA